MELGSPVPLPNFKFVEAEADKFYHLWQKLWPTSERGRLVEEFPRNAEDLDPGVLSPFICFWKADQEALNSWAPASLSVDVADSDEEILDDVSMEDGSGMDVDDDDGDDDGTKFTRYIPLTQHRELRVRQLVLCDTFIVRDEYDIFIAHLNATKPTKKGRSIFLTGHPGVGKSMSACYLLFILLASAQEVFFLVEETEIYHFSAAGVQVITDHDAPMNSTTICEAVDRSWVLVDVEGVVNERWIPRVWLQPCVTMVWTSSPRAVRAHQFQKRYQSTTWYMQPWSLTEIVALTALDDHDPKEIQKRIDIHGPVARTIFHDSYTPPDVGSIDSLIATTLERGGLNIVTFIASHRMYLMRPQPSNRRMPSYEFLSNFLVQRTTEQVDKYFEAVRASLIKTFDIPQTRAAAGKLVECVLHRALISRTDEEEVSLPEEFGGGIVAESIELIGEAKHFILDFSEPEKIAKRPIYLRPQASKFAAIDSIIVTQSIIGFVQCSHVHSHSRVVKTLLYILARLARLGFATEVARLPLLYCIVGTDKGRVRNLMKDANSALEELKSLPSARQAKILQNKTKIARERLKKLQVRGFVVHIREGLTPVEF
ncbi:hypothetical protein B0H13DRAFT_2467121 [Mycena leptocephala]|nr:hypothetical protein B0H13DRAFT_2467121 [Mycena leptocephala]